MFPSAKDLAEHKIEEHKDAHFRCRWCPSEAFDTFRTLTKHLTEKHKTRPENYLENTVLPTVLNQVLHVISLLTIVLSSYFYIFINRVIGTPTSTNLKWQS